MRPRRPPALADLLAGLDLRVARPPGLDLAALPIRHLTIDPAEVRPSTLFCARRGWYGDTHLRLSEVLAKGAAALLVSRPEAVPPGCPVPVAVGPEDPTLGLIADRFHGAPTRALRVFGVTGTKGKTTTTWLLEHVLAALGERPALLGTLTARFEEAEVEATNTTPDALVIHRFADAVRARGATALVLEISSHGLALERVAGLRFDAVGFTQLGRDHLDFHGSVEAYFEAKARLFDSVLRYSLAEEKRPAAVVVADAPGAPPYAATLLDRAPVATRRRAVTVGEGPVDRARWRVDVLADHGLDGARLRLATEVGDFEVDFPLLGAHNHANAALAAALAVTATEPPAGLADEDPADRVAAAWEALADFPGVPGRLERVGARVFVDYAHTPESVAATLTALRRAAPGAPPPVLLGCGGARDPGKRPLMAAAAAAGAEHVVLTSDNPRDEDPEAILDAMVRGLPAGASWIRDADRARAIERALERPGLVVLAGKGHERYQEIGGRKRPFDDRLEARRALEARGEDPGPPPWIGPPLDLDGPPRIPTLG